MLVEVWADITSSLCAIENLCQQLYDEYFALSAKMDVAREIITRDKNSEIQATQKLSIEELE